MAEGSSEMLELLAAAGGHNTLNWADSFAKNLFEDTYKLDSFDTHQNDSFLIPELVRQHLAAAPLFVDSQRLHKFDTAASFDHRQTLEFDIFSAPRDHAYQHPDLELSQAASPADDSRSTSCNTQQIDMHKLDTAHAISYTDISAACAIASTHICTNSSTYLDHDSLCQMEQQSAETVTTSPPTSLAVSAITSYNQATMSEDATRTTSSVGMTAATSIRAWRPYIWAGTSASAVSTCTSYNQLRMSEDATRTNTTCGGTMTHPCIWADRAACPPIPMERKLLYHAAAMQPIELSSSGENMVAKKTRRNIHISKDPQSMAARQRRQRVSEKMRVLQRLVPGGAKLDTASMLEEAAHYMRFLKAEVEKMEAMEEWMCLRAGGPICTHKFREIFPLLADDASDQSPPSITSGPVSKVPHQHAPL